MASARKINPKSLENLKMGSMARTQGKIRCTITILPETKKWLAKGGNLSGRIDELVGKYLKGDLVGIRVLHEMEERCQELEARLKSLNCTDASYKFLPKTQNTTLYDD